MKSFIKDAPKEFEEDLITLETYCATTSAYRDIEAEERRDEYRRYMQDVAAAISLALFGTAFMITMWAIATGAPLGNNLAG